MGQNSTEVAYGFGQMGSVFNNTASAITPPTGKVFVAITFLTDTTLNTTDGLVADNDDTNGLEYVGSAYDSSDAGTTADEAAHDLTVGSETDVSGGGGKAIVTATVFPKGLTIYGRWTKITTVTSGQLIAYIGV
jgi:Flp pilus assembly protein TadG